MQRPPLKRFTPHVRYCAEIIPAPAPVKLFFLVCAQISEFQSVVLTAPSGLLFGPAAFASFGLPNGTCGHFQTSACHSNRSVDVVNSRCLGRRNCSITAIDAVFTDPCSKYVKRFYVQMTYILPTQSKYYILLSESVDIFCTLLHHVSLTN